MNPSLFSNSRKDSLTSTWPSTTSLLEFAPTPASLVPGSSLSREKTDLNATLAFPEFGH